MCYNQGIETLNGKLIMVYKERDIVYENGPYWVLKDKKGFHCMVTGVSASVGESSYSALDLAVARVDYFSKNHVEGKNLKLAANIENFNRKN